MTPPDDDLDDVSSGEVYRALETFREDVRLGFSDLRTQISGLSVVSREQYESDKADTNRRLVEVESHQKWLLRLVVTAVVLGAIGLLFAAN